MWWVLAHGEIPMAGDPKNSVYTEQNMHVLHMCYAWYTCDKFGLRTCTVQPLVTLWPAPRTLTEQRKTCMCHTCAMHVIHTCAMHVIHMCYACDTHMTNLDCGHVQWKLITHAYTRWNYYSGGYSPFWGVIVLRYSNATLSTHSWPQR